jgi:polyisoprenoid-binding protein YceI
MKLSLLPALLLAASAGTAAAAEYEIDARHTQVFFTYSHAGYSNISGRFTEVSGKLDFDPADPGKASIELQLPIASLSTGVAKLDEHMLSADMFDAARFPTASFKSGKVTVVGKDKLQVAGELTIHGVSKPVLVDVSINSTAPRNGKRAAGFDASASIKRSDFGVDFMLPGVPDAVKLSITMEAREPRPPEAK